MKQELVRKWMTEDPVTVNTETSLIDAHMLMVEHDVRRLPVVDSDGILAGILTLSDIREISPSDVSALENSEMRVMLTNVNVRETMAADPIVVYTTDSISEAASQMMDNQVSGLPVIHPDGSLVGIITESDIFRLVVQHWAEPDLEAKPAANSVL